ncbi:hypothetical protein PO909_024698 [Leuciscus waleckii]
MRDHRDSQMAQNSWREIAKTLGKEDVFCRKVWKNLRDKFVKAKKKVHGRRGDPGGYKNNPPILNELSWLSQYVKHRETDSNMEFQVECLFKEEDNTRDDHISMATQSPGTSSTSASPPETTTSDSSSPVTPSPPPISPLPITLHIPPSPTPSLSSLQTPSPRGNPLHPFQSPCPLSRKRKRSTEDVLLKRLERLDEERQSAMQQDNEDYRFTLVLADMLAKVDPRKKLYVKFKLNQVLFDALRDNDA